MKYEDIDALNWSTLKAMHVSPKMLRHRADHPRRDSAALARGRLIHAVLLEPDEIAKRYAVQPDFGDCRFKANKARRTAWRADVPPGIEIVERDEYDTMIACATAVWEHEPAAALLRAGRHEAPVTWVDAETGVRCKMRGDSIAPTFVLDVKTTRHSTVRAFLNDCARYLYHGQSAWYHDGAIAGGVMSASSDLPVILAVQTTPPYDVWPLRLGAVSMERGRQLGRTLLRRYVQCLEADWWPGIAPDVTEVELPDWAAGGEDNEAEEW